MRKLLFFLFTIGCLAACSHSGKEEKKVPPDDQQAVALPGKAIFVQKCKICHGSDGQLGVSGAANLAISTLTLDEKIGVITNGRRGMASWKADLSPEQIREVAEYVETLKK